MRCSELGAAVRPPSTTGCMQVLTTAPSLPAQVRKVHRGCDAHVHNALLRRDAPQVCLPLIASNCTLLFCIEMLLKHFAAGADDDC